MNATIKLCGWFLCLAAAQSAMADVVVIVSAKSTVGNLDKDQVTDIFMGRQANFPGGGPAVAIEQVDSSPQHQEFHSKVTGKTGTQLKAYWSKQVFTGKGTPPKELGSSAEVVKLIAANPNLIGYIDKASLDSSVKTVFAP